MRVSTIGAPRIHPASDSDSFRPAPYLPGRHLQTIIPTLLPAPLPGSRHDTLLIEVEPETRLLALIDRPEGPARGTLVQIHGLGGCADSGYLRRTACIALARSWVSVRVNLRNCGGSEAYARTLYNAGQSGDAGRVLEALAALRFPRPFALVGYSLGGNLVLRYAGLSGPVCRADAVVGVNPPLDLEACVRSLEAKRNALYHVYFTWRLCRLIRKIRRVRRVPGPAALARKIRSVRRFDALFTAPDAGFGSAEEYYRHASGGPHLGGLRVPALVLSARDDPFVPPSIFKPLENDHPGLLTLLQPTQGGHVGYWQDRPPCFWAGTAVLDYLEKTLRDRGIFETRAGSATGNSGEGSGV